MVIKNFLNVCVVFFSGLVVLEYTNNKFPVLVKPIIYFQPGGATELFASLRTALLFY
jgi:hypothetical protein